jgi:hypothetical protein
MGTDIHPVWWVKRTENYYVPLRPAYDYHWYPDRIWQMKSCLNLDWGTFEYPNPGEDEPWDIHSMKKDAAHLAWLANNPVFVEANSAIGSVWGRDYDFFAIVGDVRNGYGFAGCPTGQAFTPIGKGRSFYDLPFDAREDEDSRDSLDYGEHSRSWVTLKELLEYPWDATRVSTGVIPLETADEVFNSERVGLYTYADVRKGNQSPSAWSGGIDGASIRTITPLQADHLLDGKTAREDGIKYYVQYSWPLSNRESISAATYDGIHWLAERVDPATTYLVFGFDS